MPPGLIVINEFLDPLGLAEGEGGSGGYFFDRGIADCGYGAEGAEEHSSSFGADAGDFVEDAAVLAFVADFSVVGEGEAVGFVS